MAIFVLFTVFACVYGLSAEMNIITEMMDIRMILEQQSKDIVALKKENFRLREEVNWLKRVLLDRPVAVPTKSNSEGSSEFHLHYTVPKSDDKAVMRRLLVPTTTHAPVKTPPPVQPVAFYAYMSDSEHVNSVHHPLVFDVVKTNVGDAYNKYTGVFTTPMDGLYVFMWRIYTEARGITFVDIFVNGDVYGNNVGDAQENGDWDSDSGFIVVSLNTSDRVYMRSSRAGDTVLSNQYGRTSLAGWKLY